MPWRSKMLLWVRLNRIKITLEERFWIKVDKGSDDECWIWNGALILGYGSFAGSKTEGLLCGEGRVHRICYILHKGEIPEGCPVFHTCGNKECCNPDHLELGINLPHKPRKLETKPRKKRAKETKKRRPKGYRNLE